MEPSRVIVHPVVLLSVVDHYNRVARDTKRRVVGVLLGEREADGTVDITNSYALPFEEDLKNPSVFFLDHNFHERMFAMFKKVNANEKVVGWYHSGPKLKESDLDINEIFRDYVTNPVLVIIDVKLRELGLPVEAYWAVEEIKDDGTEPRKTFYHIPSEIGALEAEEVGVEHLLRDIKDTTVSTLTHEISAKLSSLKSLHTKLREIETYVDNVLDPAVPLPPNNDIIGQLQDIFNLLPNLSEAELVRAFAIKTNDSMLSVYLAAVIRSVIALHNLIRNKIDNKRIEAAQDAAENASVSGAADGDDNAASSSAAAGGEDGEKDGDDDGDDN